MLSPLTSFRDIDFQKGALVLVNKPKGWTSFDAVNKVRHLIRKKFNYKKIKVGHSGTLDPMATGLLLICTGSWTKNLYMLQGLDKTYEAEITLGIETDSYDAEGKVVFERTPPMLSRSEAEELLSGFVGTMMQTPPVFSAIKQGGQPLYRSARAGKEVLPEPREVIVHSIQLVEWDTNRLTLNVHCGSGFYVRSLAHDIGEKLGCGAHLSALDRTRIGPYSLEDAWTIESIEAAIASIPG